METSLKHVVVIAAAIVLVVACICAAILIGTINGNQKSKDVQLACIKGAGSYVGHTCIYPVKGAQ